MKLRTIMSCLDYKLSVFKVALIETEVLMVLWEHDFTSYMTVCPHNWLV